MQLWPGGIPAAVRLCPDSDLAGDSLEEIKGWCQFLEESRTPIPDPEEDRAQRRALIEKWASADQSFRDSFHLRAPSPNLTGFKGPWASKRFICLVDKSYDPENYSRITKLLILLYIHLQDTIGHPLSFDHGSTTPQLPAFILDPATAMTRTGTVIFPYLDSCEYVVIDNQSCQDGRLYLLNFAPNGQVAYQARMLPFRLGPLMLLHHSLGHMWSELIHEKPAASASYNPPIDLHLPILQTMAGLSQRGCLRYLNDYTPAEWAEEFERFAPEYLAYESQGREYSWDRRVDVSEGPFVMYNHLRQGRQLAALKGRR
ncbi:hypothetical protein N7486_000789 [Penicillium sp. IBT 16267x]|nr:hypothetical protein N7486_000789 [Penicillium sp. IBT 16267x]